MWESVVNGSQNPVLPWVNACATPAAVKPFVTVGEL